MHLALLSLGSFDNLSVFRILNYYEFETEAMAEKYTLNWHTFSEHLQLMFKDLYEEEKHSDVTLVCDNQTQFKAHKIVLSACSPVFKKIIDNNPSQHPLIYLRGIQSYEMESILQFMYLGEGKFYYERMGEFIKVAKDLEVKEISKNVEIPIEEEDVSDETVMEKETEDDDELKQISGNTIRQRQYTDCPECGKSFHTSSDFTVHARVHSKEKPFSCNECNQRFSSANNMRAHEARHTGRKYIVI